jgi:virginiamycin B lyase
MKDTQIFLSSLAKEESTMKSPFRALGFVFLFASLSYGASGGMISGTVKGPDGSLFKGAFVRAQNEKSKITVSVLSDKRGEYRIQNLTGGKYQVRATAVGYKSDLRADVTVDGVQPVALDFAMQKGVVRWSDLSIHQGETLLPDDPGKTMLFTRCMSCHGLQTKIAGARREEDAWSNCVNLMRDLVGGVGDSRITDQVAAKVVPYLTRVFGVDSEFARSPAQLPGYEIAKHAEFSDETSKIVYVDYDLPGPNRIPWEATPNPDKEGNVWFVESWTANGIGKLNRETGEIAEVKVPTAPHVRAMHIHSVIEAPDGMVWYASSRQCQLNKFDPETQKFTAYRYPSCQPSSNYGDGIGGEQGSGQVRMDRLGNIWSDGNNLRRFDPKTEKFTEFPEGGNAYSFELAKKDGNVWFAQLEEGKIGRVDINTLKLTRWTPPATLRLAELNKDQPKEIGNTQIHPKSAGARRITSDSQGNIWFGEWWAGQIGRFDPKTEIFKEFPLPDPDPTPYGVGVDRNGFVWYSSYDDDILGRLDPKTGAVVEYPFPYSGNGIRELLPDSEGRMWFGTPFNNKVGYFIPPEGLKTASK